MAIRWSKVNNKFGEWNLPPDYDTLSAEGKKAARLNAVACRDTPADMVTAWHFFRSYYLNHEDAFFYKEYTPSAPFHYDLVGYFRDPRYRCHAIAAPRGYSKSTIVGLEVPLMEICSPSKPAFELALILSKDTMVEERFDRIMMQLEENPRILEDFGRLRPEIGCGVWNRHYLRLKNRVTVKGFSVEGKKRGARPDLIIIDDPEQDPATNTDKEVTMADMDNMLVRQVLGMMLPSSRLLWVGTLLHQRAYLHHILTDNTDLRFRSWNKRHYGECTSPETEDDLSKYLWPERFDRKYLISKKEEMGPGAYLTEFCNQPRSDIDTLLQIDPVLNEYKIDGQQPQQLDNPLQCKTPLTYHDCGNDQDQVVVPIETTQPFGLFVDRMARFAFVDYAPTTHATSDYSAIVVVGRDDRNTLFVLDCWQGKVRPNELIRTLWDMGRKWQVQVVGVEAVGVQKDFQQQVADVFDALVAKGEWVPKVVPVTYPQKVSKAERIASLEWRFRQGRIKMPQYIRYGPFMALRDQIEGFTMDLSRLPHDDLVDALAMYHSLVKGSSKIVSVPAKVVTLQDRLTAGQLTFDEHSGISVLSGLMASELTQDVVAAMEAARAERMEYDADTGGWSPDYPTNDTEKDYLW